MWTKIGLTRSSYNNEEPARRPRAALFEIKDLVPIFPKQPGAATGSAQLNVFLSIKYL